MRDVIECHPAHLAALTAELRAAGVALTTTATDSQCTTLLRALRYLGGRGINTYEAVAAGYARVATRVFELEQSGYRIHTVREDVIGPDGLLHPRVARYMLAVPSQGALF